MLMKSIAFPRLKSRVRTLSALVAASIVLTALAYADRDNDKDSHRENNGRGDNDEHHANRNIPVVPEANAGWVLIPFLKAVLLFSGRNLFGGKVAE